MADLFNQQISATYSGLLKTSSSGVLSASLTQITDGRGNGSPLYISTTVGAVDGAINFYNAYTFPSADGLDGQVLKTDGAGVLTWENDSLSNTLDFSGGTGTGSVTLDTQTLAFTGTANQIETSASSQAITLSFPTAGVTLPDGSIATTQTANDNSLKVATTAFVINEIATSGISGSGADDQIAVFDGSNSVSSSSSFQYDGRILTLQDGVTGDKNIVIGNSNTFPTSNSSTGNVIIGNNAFNDVSQFHTGGENIIIGLNAGQNGTKLSSNILIGKNAGSSLGNVAASTQNSNVFIGQFAGSEITATEGNVIIGGFDGNDGTIIITTDNNNVVLSTGLGAVRAWFNSTGTLRLSAYNASNKTGTVTYLLGTDNSGNVLKTTAGTGTVAGTGTAGTITKWATGGADIEDSIITESASAITVSGNNSSDLRVNIDNLTDGYASKLSLYAANDAGARFNYLSSGVKGATAMWRIDGGGVNNNLVMYTGGSEAVRISSGGDVTLNQALSVIKGGGSSTGRFQVANHDTTSYMIITGNTYSPTPNTISFVTATTNTALTISSGGQVIVGGSAWNGVSGVDGGFGIEGNNAQFLLDNPSYNHFTMYSASDSNIYNVFGTSGNYLIGTGNKDTSSWTEKMRISSGGTITSSVTAGDNLILEKPTGAYLSFKNGSTLRGSINGNNGTDGLNINYGASHTPALTISSGGAATFSGSVTCVQLNASVAISMEAAGTNSVAAGGYYRYLNTSNSYQILKQINTNTDEDTWAFRGSWNKIGTLNASTGVYTALSDINKKKDFEESTIGLSAIIGLKPTLYRMKDDESEGKKELGFIAQEVKDYIPQAYVENGDDDYQFVGLNYNAIVATLTKAIQEQQTIIEDLKSRIETLEG